MKPLITTEKIFNMSANTYETTEEQTFQPIHIKTLVNSKKFLKRSDDVLDYGCATGTKSLEIASHVHKIQGIDISAKMIEIAKRRAIERNIENVDFAQTTIFDARYERESFDVVLAFNILHLLEDHQRVLRRKNELLKPNGLFISVTTCLREKMTFNTKLQFSLPLLLVQIGLISALKRFRYPELKHLITNGNFQIIETEKLFHGMSFYFIAAKKL